MAQAKVVKGPEEEIWDQDKKLIILSKYWDR